MKTYDYPLTYEFDAIDKDLLRDYQQLMKIDLDNDLYYVLGKIKGFDIEALCDNVYKKYNEFVNQRLSEFEENLFGKVWRMESLSTTADGNSVVPCDKGVIYMYDWKPQTGYLFAILADDNHMPYSFSVSDTTFSVDACEEIFTARLRFIEVNQQLLFDMFAECPKKVFEYRIRRENEKKEQKPL